MKIVSDFISLVTVKHTIIVGIYYNSRRESCWVDTITPTKIMISSIKRK